MIITRLSKSIFISLLLLSSLSSVAQGSGWTDWLFKKSDACQEPSSNLSQPRSAYFWWTAGAALVIPASVLGLKWYESESKKKKDLRKDEPLKVIKAQDARPKVAQSTVAKRTPHVVDSTAAVESQPESGDAGFVLAHAQPNSLTALIERSDLDLGDKGLAIVQNRSALQNMVIDQSVFREACMKWVTLKRSHMLHAPFGYPKQESDPYFQYLCMKEVRALESQYNALHEQQKGTVAPLKQSHTYKSQRSYR